MVGQADKSTVDAAAWKEAVARESGDPRTRFRRA